MIGLLLGLLTPLAAEPPPPAPVIRKSALDYRLYREITLENGVRVLLVADGNIGFGAAAVTVGRGSDADPLHRLGLAHLYEHMLFMGTTAHPDPDAFTRFVEERGGNRDATTHSDHTTFVFEIPRDDFPEGLGRFADFFSEPALAPEAIERERQAVHSEFSLRREDEGRRLASVLRQGRPLDHPMARFGVGTEDTLGDRPGSDLRADLLAFREANYTGDQITVALVDRRSLDGLEELAREAFADVPPGPAAPLPTPPAPFLPEAVGAEILISLPDRRNLQLHFPLPPVQDAWAHHPLLILSDLFGDEGEGSILAELRARGWARELAAGADEHPDHSLLRLEILLTEEGLAHRDEVVASVFAYADLLRASDLQRVYDENARIRGTQAALASETPPLRGMEALAEAMQYLPTEHLLDAGGHFAPYDRAVFDPFLDGIRPENLRLILISPEVQTDRYAPLYRTHFSSEPFSAERIAAFGSAPAGLALHLPAPNPYLPRTDTPAPFRYDAKTRQRRGLPGLDLWVQRDTRFRKPDQVVLLDLTLPQLAAHREQDPIALRALVTLLDHHLKELTYPAVRAGLSTAVVNTPSGLFLALSGHQDAQEVFLADLVARIQTFEPDPAQLEHFRQAVRDGYARFARSRPIDLADDLPGSLLYPDSPSLRARIAAVETLETTDLQALAQTLREGVPGRMFLYGDVDRRRRKALVDAVAPLVDTGPEVQKSVRQVPEAGLRMETSSPQADSAVLLLVQADGDVRTEAAFRVLNAYTRTEFFSQLRTREQLGYVVGTWTDRMRDSNVLHFAVQSNTAGPDALEDRIDRFLTELPERIGALEPSEFLRLRSSVLEALDQHASSPSALANENFDRILRGDPRHRRPRALFEAVRDLSPADLIEAAEQLEHHRLILRIRGSGSPHGDGRAIDCDPTDCPLVEELPVR